jgi:hypothetical protein
MKARSLLLALLLFSQTIPQPTEKRPPAKKKGKKK